MRIYIPATSDDIACDVISERTVHAVTPQLVAATDVSDVHASEQRDVLEAIAMNSAADDSLRRLMSYSQDASHSVQPRRVVIVADAPDNFLEACTDSEQLPSALTLSRPLSWKHVESIHIDDDEALDDIGTAIVEGGEAAFALSYDHELMWYDVTERDDLIRTLLSPQ